MLTKDDVVLLTTALQHYTEVVQRVQKKYPHGSQLHDHHGKLLDDISRIKFNLNQMELV